jgi:hypothetical protein
MRADEEIQWFANWMRYKTSLNEHKDGWRESTFVELRDMLSDEIEELHLALTKFLMTTIISKPRELEEAYFELVSECADVANFAMFIGDKASGKVQRMYIDGEFDKAYDNLSELRVKMSELKAEKSVDNRNSPVAMPINQSEPDAEYFERHILSTATVPNLTELEEFDRWKVSEFCMKKHPFGYLYYTWISFRDGSIYTKDNIEPKG